MATTKVSGTMTTTPREQGKVASKGRKLNLNTPAKARDYFTSKEQFILSPKELFLAIQAQPDLINIIDVRQPMDYAKGHLPGAINLPRDQGRSVTGLKKDRLNVIYCYSLDCPLAGQAAVEFADQGFSVMEMIGGYEAWLNSGLQTDKQVHH